MEFVLNLSSSGTLPRGHPISRAEFEADVHADLIKPGQKASLLGRSVAAGSGGKSAFILDNCKKDLN